MIELEKNEYRILITGFIVTKHWSPETGRVLINQFPLEFDGAPDAGIGCGIEGDCVGRDDEIIGVFPALPNTYAIYRIYNDNQKGDELVRYDVGDHKGQTW